MKQKILSLFVFAIAMLISITANAKVEKFATATPQKVQTEMFLPLKMTQLVKGQPQKMAKQNVGRVEQKTLLGKKVKANHQQAAPVKFASKKAPKTAGANYDVAGVDWYYDDYYYDVYVYSEDATYIFELTENLQYGKDYTYADMVPEWVCTLDAEGYPDVTATDATLNVSKDEAGMVHIVATMVLNGDTYNLKFDEKPFVPSGVKINLDGTELEGQYMSYYGMYVYFAKVGENDIQLAFDATAEQDIFTADQLIADYCMYASSDYSMFVEFVKAASDFTVTKTATTKTLSGSVYAKNGDEYVLNLVCEIPAPKDMNINVTDATLTDRTAAGYWMIDGQTADKNNAISLYFIGKEFEGTFTDVNNFEPSYTYVSDKSSGSNVYYDSPSAINITSAIVGDSLCIDGTMTVTSSAGAIANVTLHVSTPYAKQSEWTEWEPFAPGGSNDAVWTLTAWQKGQLPVKAYVHSSTANPAKKQIKCEGWGAGLFTAEGVDIILDWNTTDNTIEIPMQSTGYYVSNYKDYAVLGTFETGKYDPEQGKFSFHVGYSVPQYYVMEQGFGFGDETLQMAGEFKNYDISFSRGTVDDEATPIKQTVNVVPGKDVTSYRVHVDTYENYAAAQGSAAYFEALAKADGTDYTEPCVTVDLQGSDYNIYVVVVSAFANGEMKKYDYDLYEVSPASDWETVGVRPYREDIVTSLYNFGITGPVYNVEVQKHKTYRDIYRIKNPYGSTSPFGSYSLYENAYLYLNAQDPTNVKPTFQLSKCDLGVDIEGGVPLDVYLADKTVGGTYDGYAISFPTKALVSDGYYVNTNGLFRAVINFKDPVIATTDDATSVLVKETVKITSDNKFSTPVFESLTPEIATVDAKGVVTGVAPGMAKIKVVQDSILEFNAVDTTLEIEVLKNDFVYGEFIFNTDEGLAALGIEKPAASAATNLTGKTLTSDVVSMALTDGTNPTRVWNTSGATDLRMYKSGGSFTFSVPEGYSIINIDFTGTECSLFGEEAEFETCTKAHTVWNAPADTITSKTFAAVGTCKINVIKVKVAAPGDPTGINEINNFPTIDAEGIFNLRGQKVSSMQSGNVYIVNGKKYIAK